MGRIIAGVMGPGDTATDAEMRVARELGALIAGQGWILLNGGRNAGVMQASSRGAGEAGGMVVGILPGSDTSGMSPYIDIPIVTGMLDARNSINILSISVVFFIGMSPGTASELALALKHKKPVILLAQREEVVRAFQSMTRQRLETAPDALSAIAAAKRILGAEPA